ncbi:uncharacterized protein LOC109504195 isoform X1 [Harpegnathos saltator]|uniref:uncharacterized protein LOC109504195 isoform X1 n=1 Tax=Harpegnathos saltator TaxID=610380 RepID=UPI000DBEEB7D|nr:uncharacterized protein LOC109504195 isoform X1 [Harpegnathos saltator]
MFWANEHKVQHHALSSLLKILKTEGHDDFPNDARTLLNTPRCTNIYKTSGGDYYHHGLKNGIINILCQQNNNCSLWTDESFKFRQNPEHHTGISSFEEIPLPMVTIFPLDYMHLIRLGQMKKLLHLWLKGPRIAARLSGLQNGTPVIIGQEYINYSSYTLYPCDSRHINVFVIDDDLTELKCFPISEISKKAVVLPWNGEERFCAFPLLHSDILEDVVVCSDRYKLVLSCSPVMG